MADNSTRPTDVDVMAFLHAVADERRRADGLALCARLEQVTGLPPVMWGPTMVGFGTRHYRYASGREGDIFRVGFSPRKAELVLYGLYSAYDDDPAVLERLGKVKAGKGCVYAKRVSDLNLDVFDELALRALQVPDDL